VLILFCDPGDDPLESLVSNPAKYLVAQFAVKALCFHDAVLYGRNPTQIPDSRCVAYLLLIGEREFASAFLWGRALRPCGINLPQ
jgi:hypothetical protein